MESNDAVSLDGLSGRAVGEGRIGVEAGHGRIFPWAMNRLPASNDPALTGGVTAGNPTAVNEFVGVDALIETGQAL